MLMIAISEGLSDFVEFLLSKGADAETSAEVSCFL